MDKLSVAKILIKLGCVQLRPDDPFTYASGLKGPVYCDNRLLISHVVERRQVAQAFVQVIEASRIEYDLICGVATAGIPHACWVADILQRPMVYVRSQAKGHGKKNCVEGLMPRKSRLLMIEDLVNQGKSSMEAVDNIHSEGGEVLALLSIVDYQMKAAQKRIAQRKIPFFSLTDFESLIQAAFDLGELSGDQVKVLAKWQDNPEG